jgi:hypothetical protein
LFDVELAEILGKRAKTCFVDSFDFELFAAGINGNVEIPLKEFLNYIPQTDMTYYKGSYTEPDCEEHVSWYINTAPFVITQT